MKAAIVKVLTRHWWKILAGAILAGFLTEVLNTYVFRWWIYHKPWSVFFLPAMPIGAPLILGWLAITSAALLLTIVFENIRPRTKPQLYWVLSWILLGVIIEFVNSRIWQTWHYAPGTLWANAILPFLNFSIFTPIVGWGATGIITFWAYKYFVASFGKGPYRDPVCWMKVGDRIKTQYKGETFYFCSGPCKATFEKSPVQFAKNHLKEKIKSKKEGYG